MSLVDPRTQPGTCRRCGIGLEPDNKVLLKVQQYPPASKIISLQRQMCLPCGDFVMAACMSHVQSRADHPGGDSVNPFREVV